MIPNVGYNPHLETPEKVTGESHRRKSPERFKDELIRFLSRGT